MLYRMFPLVKIWSPTLAVRASLLAHSAAFGWLLAEPRSWPEIVGLLGANHALLACGMRPKSAMLGANLIRLPSHQAGFPGAVALTFDDGPDPEITPRLLDLLDVYDAKASFFVIGHRASQHPDIMRDIAARGHSVENHTYWHPLSFGCWTPGAMLREIRLAQEVIIDTSGQAPMFFRAPAGIRNPLLDPVLAMTGLRLCTWTRRGYDTILSDPNCIYKRLTRGLSDGDILALHDRRTRSGSAVLPVTRLLLERLRQENFTSVSLRMTRDETCDAEAAQATATAYLQQAACASR
jgi:peptidoglycan/xylan/chitin deacetylase (PgdA/CDA1 family)